MKLVLATKYSSTYWQNRNGRAPFANQTNDTTIANNWEQINAQCPMIGIGYYKNSNTPNGTTGNENFEYIKIIGITRNAPNDYTVNFSFIKSSKTTSNNLRNLLPPGKGYIFSVFNDNSLNQILLQLHEELPVLEITATPQVQNDINANNTQRTPSDINNWKNFIGDYYKELLNSNLSDSDYEDRVYELLIAIGFNVNQKGHIIKGPYPDGIILFENNYMIIYDCKNSDNYFMDLQESRKMNDYIQAESIVNPNKDINGIFIARNYSSNLNRNNYYFYTIDSLLYLLYKRLKKGKEFNVINILRSIRRNQDLNINIIDTDFN